MPRPSQLKTDFAKALHDAGLSGAEFARLSGYSYAHIKKLMSDDIIDASRPLKMLELINKGKE